MNPFNVEDQYQFYLKKIELPEAKMHLSQRIQLRDAFMGASGIILLLIRDEFAALTNDEGDAMFTSMIDQVDEYWKARMEGIMKKDVATYEPPKPLRRLTDMTHEEFASFFGREFAPSYSAEKIENFTSLRNIHYCIASLGDFDTYERLVDAGFDMTFTLDRKGEKKS